MKNSPYSPDNFMNGIYDSIYANPYADVLTKDDAMKTSKEISQKARSLFSVDTLKKLAPESFVLTPSGKKLEYPGYTVEKFSFELLKGLESAVYILKPKNINKNTPSTVALCGHGYGVRQILSVTKSGRKKILPYADNYQKNFAVELAKRGCVVAAPELFGFGEARLKKDLKKPFYISSCEELSHHLLPYGLTTASIRIFQASACGEILLGMGVNPEKLSCMGISGGGLTALYSSVVDERFRKVVISGYVNTLRESILSLWHCPDNYIPGMLEIGEIYDFASSLAPRKLLIESGEKDRLFPIKASKKAHEEIKRIYALSDASDKLIIDVFSGKHQVSGRLSFDFLSE